MNTNMLLKQELDGRQLAILNSEMENRKKSKGIMYALWWFTGVFGGHRFYLGNIGRAIAMLLTLGGFGLWTLIDVFFIGKRYEKITNQLELEIINQIKSMNKIA